MVIRLRARIAAAFHLAAILAFTWITCALHAQTTINLNSSMSASAIQSAVAGQNNSVINFASGTYNITSQLSMPCVNVTVQGPTIANLATPAAILNGSSIGTSGAIFLFPSGCNGLTIRNLWLENAGWINFAPGNTTNITITNVKGTGLPDIGGGGDCCDGPNGIDFQGNISTSPGGGNSPTDSNITLTYLTLGDSSSCPNSFATGEVNSACTAVWMQPGTLTNFTFENNWLFHLNEGLKFAQTTNAAVAPAGEPDNVYSGSCVVDYNYFQAIHRISFENQFDAQSTCNIDHNAVLVDGGLPYFGTLTFSMACCTFAGTFDGSPLGISPGYTNNDMMMVSSIAPFPGSTGAPFADEFWGINPQMIGSYLEGYFFNMVSWNCANSPSFTYPPGTSTSCLVENTYMCVQPGFSTTFINNEEGGSPPPTEVNNTKVTTGCQATTSTAPTISPNGGSIPGSQTVTLSNSGTNTSTWYTTDGSTPVPGSNGTLYTGAFSISGNTTVKAVGMWGVPPQPTSWPSGFGFVPSSVVTATFTNGGGSPTVAQPTFSPTSGTFTGSQSVVVSTATSGAALHCTTNGTTPTSSSPLYTGPFSLTSSTTIECLGTESGFNNSPVGTATYSTSAAVTLNAVTLTNAGASHAITTGVTNQFMASCLYSDGSTTSCNSADSHGNHVNSWSSSNSSAVSINGTGLATGIGPGSANITATVGAVTSAAWAITDSTATGFTIPAGASTSSVQSTINSAAASGGGNTVMFSSGNYSITPINIPCPVSPLTITGPPTGYPTAWNARPTAVIKNANTGESPQLFSVAGGCSTPISILYLEINGNQPTSGGGSIFVNAGTNNVTIQYNWLHGNQEITPTTCGTGCVNYDDENATLIWLDGFTGSSSIGSLSQNILIQYNIFGFAVPGNPSAGDCGNVMTWAGTCTNTSTGDGCNFVGYDTTGGMCSALGVHTSTNNLNFSYNIILQQEQGTKWYEGGGSYPQYFFQMNDVMEYNDIEGYHRIGTEDQQSSILYPGPASCTSQPNNACMQRKYNDMQNNVNPSFGNWGFSLPNIGYEDNNDNLMISENFNSATQAGPADFEDWGYGTNDHNLEQGYVSCGHDVGYGFPSSVSNNIHQFPVANCSITNSSGLTVQGIQPEFSTSEGFPVSSYPTMTGNTYATSVSTVTSVAPTISPAGGSFSGSQIVTLTDLGNVSGVGPRGNTGIWCTMDGSNPLPKSGTAQYYATGSTITLTSSTTLSCRGMWGAITQPGSYPSGYGFVPSAAVTFTFTNTGGGGGGTITTVVAPSLSPAGPLTFTTAFNAILTPNTAGAAIYYTLDGSTPTTSSTLYTGPINITSTITLSAMSAMAGSNNSSVVTATYTYSLSLGNPLQNVNIQTIQNAVNAVYAVTGSAGNTTISPTNIASSLTGWSTCILSACNPGGSGTPTGTSQTVGNSSPSGAPSGTSMLLSETANTSFTNALWPYKSSTACDTCANFSDSFEVYLGSNSAQAGSFEYDVFDFAQSLNTEFMWGMQWNQASGVWQVFNQAAGSWVNTSVTTALSYSSWHHIQRTYHRVQGDTSNCSGQPCMYYDTLTIDGTAHVLNMVEPAGTLPTGWTSAIGWQAQIDIGTISGSQTVLENLDQVAFTATGSGGYTVSSGNVCLTNGVVTPGASTDVIIGRATSPTGQSATELCHGTWTNTSSSTGPGCVTVAMSGCPTLTSSTAYWVETVTNDPLTTSPLAGWNCGGACSLTPVPTAGNGTYTNFFGSLTYGGPYTALPTTLTGGTSQPSVWLNLTPFSNPTAATPVISPPNSTFVGSQTVSISDMTPGSIVHYTTDGSMPTSSSQVYVGPFMISATTTVNAIAVATGFMPSAIATTTYTAGSATFSYAYLQPGSADSSNYTVLGSPINFTAVIGYTDGFQDAVTCAGSGCADARGTYVSSWASLTPATGTIDSTGLFSPVAIGSTFIQANVTYTGGTTSAFWVEYVSLSADISLYGVSLYGVGIQ